MPTYKCATQKSVKDLNWGGEGIGYVAIQLCTIGYATSQLGAARKSGYTIENGYPDNRIVTEDNEVPIEIESGAAPVTIVSITSDQSSFNRGYGAGQYNDGFRLTINYSDSSSVVVDTVSKLNELGINVSYNIITSSSYDDGIVLPSDSFGLSTFTPSASNDYISITKTNIGKFNSGTIIFSYEGYECHINLIYEESRTIREHIYEVELDPNPSSRLISDDGSNTKIELYPSLKVRYAGNSTDPYIGNIEIYVHYIAVSTNTSFNVGAGMINEKFEYQGIQGNSFKFSYSTPLTSEWKTLNGSSNPFTTTLPTGYHIDSGGAYIQEVDSFKIRKSDQLTDPIEVETTTFVTLSYDNSTIHRIKYVKK